MTRRGRPHTKPRWDRDEHQYVGWVPTPEQIREEAARIRQENFEAMREPEPPAEDETDDE